MKRRILLYCTNRSMIVVPEAVYQREIFTKRGVQKTNCYNYNSQQNSRLKWHHSSLHNEWSLQLHTVNPVLNLFRTDRKYFHIEVSGYSFNLFARHVLLRHDVLYYDELISKVSEYRMLKKGIINTRKVETKNILAFSYCDKRWNSAKSFW